MKSKKLCIPMYIQEFELGSESGFSRGVVPVKLIWISYLVQQGVSLKRGFDNT